MKKLCALLLFGLFFVSLGSAHAGPVEHCVFQYPFTIYSQNGCPDENIVVDPAQWHLAVDFRGPNPAGKRGHCRIHLNLQDYTAEGESGSDWLVQITGNAVHNWTVDHNEQQVGTITVDALLINLEYCHVVKYNFTLHCTVSPDGQQVDVTIVDDEPDCCGEIDID